MSAWLIFIVGVLYILAIAVVRPYARRLDSILQCALALLQAVSGGLSALDVTLNRETSTQDDPSAIRSAAETSLTVAGLIATVLGLYEILKAVHHQVQIRLRKRREASKPRTHFQPTDEVEGFDGVPTPELPAPPARTLLVAPAPLVVAPQPRQRIFAPPSVSPPPAMRGNIDVRAYEAAERTIAELDRRAAERSQAYGSHVNRPLLDMHRPAMALPTNQSRGDHGSRPTPRSTEAAINLDDVLGDDPPPGRPVANLPDDLLDLL